MKDYRKIAEKILKRKLKEQEVVHHIDLNHKNNQPENLAIFENQTEHRKFHNQLNQFGWTNPLKRKILKRCVTPSPT